MLCDLKAVEIILTFSIGGIGLRALIALVKKWLKVEGVLALGLAFLMCALASGAYLAIVHQFSWTCVFLIATNVFAGSQVTYQATK